MLSIVVVIIVFVVRGIEHGGILGGSVVIVQDFVLCGWVIFVGVMVELVGVNTIFVGVERVVDRASDVTSCGLSNEVSLRASDTASFSLSLRSL